MKRMQQNYIAYCDAYANFYANMSKPERILSYCVKNLVKRGDKHVKYKISLFDKLKIESNYK